MDSSLVDLLRNYETQYVLCGSSLLYKLGIRSDINDIDISTYINSDIWHYFLNLGFKPQLHPISGYTYINVPDKFSKPMELLDGWHYGFDKNFDQLYTSKIVLDNLNFMNPEDILNYKFYRLTKNYTSKDLNDIRALLNIK